MADWSELPNDIIYKVATYLSAVEDFLAFSAVCRSWRSIYLAKEWHPGTQVPVLMFSDDENSSIRSFLRLHRSKVSNTELPEANGKRCWGSSSGWIVTIGNDHKIQLLNPCTRVSINLPPMSSIDSNFGAWKWYEIIGRAFVFKKPCTSNATEDLLVMLIYGGMRELAFCKPGDSSWKRLKGERPCNFIDLACVKDQIFALSDMGHLALVDVDRRLFIYINGYTPPKDFFRSFCVLPWDHIFLVESSGDLWMVYDAQVSNEMKYYVEFTEYMVHSYNFDTKDWIRLSNLGSRTIFLSDSNCIAVSAPHYLNCECNSIYFVAAEREKRWPNRVTRVDLGVYSFSSRHSRPLRINPDIQETFSFPYWLMPTLQ